MLPTALNGALGFAEYCRQKPRGLYEALAFTVVMLNRDGTRIAEKVSFVRRPELFTKFGFPERIE